MLACLDLGACHEGFSVKLVGEMSCSPAREELSSKLAGCDEALTDAHHRLSAMVRAEDYTSYPKLRASIDKQFEWMQVSSPVARAMLGRLQPKKLNRKKDGDSAAGSVAGAT